jgi:hypothetical protein
LSLPTIDSSFFYGDPEGIFLAAGVDVLLREIDIGSRLPASTRYMERDG